MKQPPHSVITDYRAHVHKMEGEQDAVYHCQFLMISHSWGDRHVLSGHHTPARPC
jgi:hypothetical protein